jgi:hypothetical protein
LRSASTPPIGTARATPPPGHPPVRTFRAIDLAALEDCANTELTAYFGKRGGYRFHRDGCWADVVLDGHGEIVRFTPDDKQLCETVIRQCAR